MSIHTFIGSNILVVAALAVCYPAVAESPLDRGSYLVNGIVACGNCHTPKGGPMQGVEFAGGLLIDEAIGTIYAPNISPDAETGIGKWTDKQLKKLIREGIRPDGSVIGPVMPVELYRSISDNDLDAIVSYVQAREPVSNQVPKSTWKIPLPPSYGPPVKSVADTPRGDVLAYGAYLAGPLGHCVECHTPMVDNKFDYEHQLGGGGRVIAGPWGISVSRNITPDAENGIGRLSDEQIKTAITTGVRADGTHMKPPMGFEYYANISDQDLTAIVSYLHSLQPLSN